MSDPDRALARKAGRGDRDALLTLYERHKGRLFGYLRRALRDRTLAEDVFQEVWIKVMQGIELYRPSRATFRAWLFRIAANAAVDRVRREAVRAADPLDAPLETGEGRVVDRVASPRVAPDREGEGHLFGEALDRALGKLREGQRQAVLLRHQQGLSYPEIAVALGVREGTAKTMVHRGVMRLRDELADWAPAGSSDAD
ncbi:MAG TPA: RNA polymerase sigma factor [Candidatus Polarisedimenticolaceae bacterium]|nr:RNA polymerase sigma factor [Candidatus Polarisedimenticolaceae bacterium]